MQHKVLLMIEKSFLSSIAEFATSIEMNFDKIRCTMLFFFVGKLSYIKYSADFTLSYISQVFLLSARPFSTWIAEICLESVAYCAIQR